MQSLISAESAPDGTVLFQAPRLTPADWLAPLSGSLWEDQDWVFYSTLDAATATQNCVKALPQNALAIRDFGSINHVGCRDFCGCSLVDNYPLVQKPASRVRSKASNPILKNTIKWDKVDGTESGWRYQANANNTGLIFQVAPAIWDWNLKPNVVIE